MARSFSALPQNAKHIEPFKLSIADKDISDLQQLLRLSRIPSPSFENTQDDRRYGVTVNWLAQAKDYWLKQFNWRQIEAEVNAFPNFTASIPLDGHTYCIHFMALFSRNPAAVPVISSHGWPGSVLEFLPQLRLTSEAYNPDTLPYHLIIPSLPGYALSDGPPADKDFNIYDASHLLHLLLTQYLGFDRYISTGGDIGSGVARIQARKYNECRGCMINFCSMLSTPELEAIKLDSDWEKQCVDRANQFYATGAAYAAEQGTRPGTLGLVLESNPLALLAWVGEKFLAWTDQDPSMDTILADVTLYWFTNTISRCFYPYRQRYEKKVAAGHAHPDLHLDGKPFGYQHFPKEIAPTPKAWVETTGSLSWYREHDSGGHFAAMEKPVEMKDDLENFLKHVQEEGH